MRSVILAGLCALVLVGVAPPAQAQRGRPPVRQNVTINNFNARPVGGANFVRGGVGHVGQNVRFNTFGNYGHAQAVRFGNTFGGYGGYGHGSAITFGGYSQAAFVAPLYAAPLVIAAPQPLLVAPTYAAPAALEAAPQRERIIIIER